MARVLVTDHVGADLEIERLVLASLDPELVVAAATDAETLAGLAAEVDAILVCYAKLDRAVIEAAAAGGVRVISRSGIEIDNVDVEAASQRGILVTYQPDYCLDEVADHTLALLLASVRGLFEASRSVQEGEWMVPQSGIHSLRGRVLALVGWPYRDAGGGRALGFGLRVVAFDPFLTEPPVAGIELEESSRCARRCRFRLAPCADDAGEPSPRPRGDDRAHDRAPVPLNTSRGGLVDLDAVLAALDDGRLAGVALDVTDPEPLPASHPLRTHPRAIVTPHMAYYSAESQDELKRRSADEIRRALTGESPRSPVNAEALAAAAP